jgi:hypothetical protein
MTDRMNIHDRLCPYPSNPYPMQCFYCELIVKARKDEKTMAQNIASNGKQP